MAEGGISPGDTVRLNSGGSIMSVSQVAEYMGEISAWCTWMEKVGQRTEVKRDVFALVILEKLGPAQGGSGTMMRA